MTIQSAILANPNATDAEILAIVNAQKQRKIHLPSVRRLYSKYRMAGRIEAAKLLGNADLTALCFDAQDFLKMRFDDDNVQLGTDHDDFMASMDGLYGAGVLPSEMKAEVEALAFDVPTYTEADVTRERRRGTRDSKASAASATYNAYVAALDAAWQAGTDMDAVGTLEVVA